MNANEPNAENITAVADINVDAVLRLSGYFFKNKYLLNVGYVRSLVENRVVDASGQPTPWYVYPAIDICRERVSADLSVFEFGCGYGTFWWAARVKKVTIVEHNLKWYRDIVGKFPANVRPIYKELIENGEYSHILQALAPFKYDVIIIDGRDRVNCARNCPQSLTDRGIIIWDNTDRERYTPGREFLKASGFKELRLFGLTPMVPVETNATSFFYRNGNCFDL